MIPLLRFMLAAGLVVGCTFQPGTSFARLRQAEIKATFAPTSARLDAQGRLKTDGDYRVTIDTLTLRVGRLTFEETTGTTGGQATTFDPSKPPPGYLICHNGHCDRADGALIPYEDVQAELSGTTRTTRTVLSLTADQGMSVASGTASVPLKKPPAADALERGTWTRAVLALETLEATGTVADPTSAQRLGGQVREWSLKVTPASFSHKVAVTIDRRQGATLDLVADLALTDKLWDQIDWQTLATTPGKLMLEASSSVRAQLRENFSQSRFSVSITR